MQSKELRAFGRQKWSAADRGIDFLFTFDRWVSWWETQLGQKWFELRGRSKGKYVMARIGDSGPYIESNVICLTVSQNSAEGTNNYCDNNGAVKLTPAQVIEIRKNYVPYSREFGANAFAKKYGVVHGTIGPCVRGETWRGVRFGWNGLGEPKREKVI